MAAFQCYYAAHYADCEHEIEPIQSGHRLALVYLLCYSGETKGKIPSADAMSHHLSGLRDVLSNLPANDSMLLLPLEHRYTDTSISSLGADALKGNDRRLQRGLEEATGGKYKFLILHVSRTEVDYDLVHEWSSDHRDPEIVKAYDTTGNDLTDKIGWIKEWVDFRYYDHGEYDPEERDMTDTDGSIQEFVFRSVEKGGIIIVRHADGPIEDMWGEADNNFFVFYGKRPPKRERTYHPYCWRTPNSAVCRLN